MQYTEILLVEDNRDDAELIMNALKNHRMLSKINYVTDGAEALDFVYRRGNFSDRSPAVPRLIILDLKLPKLHGHEVLKTLKNDPETKAIPVVIMTASQEEDDRTKSYHLGVNSYIMKPHEADAFVKIVSDLGMYWMMLNESTDNG